ncbi:MULTISPECIES: MJ0042-type zinc finger domain-containing protein [unclassified Acinetobacter]|uniref:MJ0042-type zinc finger domain-containing protein n=1 Tax=unclassified Acinetobacter TaxID=196816 RepID=UPI0035B9617C
MKYLIQCPKCNTIYQVSLLELSISASKVRCVECEHIFVGYENFIEDPEQQEQLGMNSVADVLFHHQNIRNKVLTPKKSPISPAHHRYAEYVEGLLKQDIIGSKLDLFAYLNYMGMINPMHTSDSRLDDLK